MKETIMKAMDLIYRYQTGKESEIIKKIELHMLAMLYNILEDQDSVTVLEALNNNKELLISNIKIEGVQRWQIDNACELLADKLQKDAELQKEFITKSNLEIIERGIYG